MSFKSHTALCIIFIITKFYYCQSSNQSQLLKNVPQIIGFMSKSPHNQWSKDSPAIIEIPSEVEVEFEIYGRNMKSVEFVAFSISQRNWSENCDIQRTTSAFPFLAVDDSHGVVKVIIPVLANFKAKYFFCCKISRNITTDPIVKMSRWIYSTSDTRISFRTFEKKSLLPLWIQIIIIIILFMLSGLFSGLNLGLMALDMTDLTIIEKAGSPNERRYAKIIRPIRSRGNFLLCTLLLGNVLVNNTLAILMDDLTGSGLLAVIFSTVGIVVLGEIIPQAICSRHGLCIGAKTVWITKFFMLITGIISFPISKALDCVLGKELGQVYNRAKLDILVKEQQLIGSVVKDEAQIIAGALTLTTKQVKDIMTPLRDVFMIAFNAVLDFDTMNEIVRNGFTRVPIYDEERSNIKAVLNVKDLAFIDPDDKIPVSTVCTFYNRSILIVPDTTNLKTMLEDFRQGKAHMAFVEKIECETDGDPYHVLIGLVTLEDVIEEIIQAEIMDETDVFTDNVRKQKRLLRNQDFSVFNIPETGKYPRLSPQLKVAALRHLTSNVTYFSEDFLTLQVLQSLLNANIVVEHTFKSGDNSDSNIIYQANRDSNFAVLILQGKVNVEVSADKLLFEAGPFVLFGESLFKKVLYSMENKESLFTSQHNVGTLMSELTTDCHFKPDYTVVAVSNLQFLKITAKHYLFARLLSLWQNAGITSLPSNTKVPDTVLSTPTITPSLSCDQQGSGSLRYKKSLTLTTMQVIRDFYQSEWEKHVECQETGDDQIPCILESKDWEDSPKKPLLMEKKGVIRESIPQMNYNEDCSQDTADSLFSTKHKYSAVC